VRQKGFAPIFIVLIIALLGIGGYLAYKNNLTKNSSPVATQTPINGKEVRADVIYPGAQFIERTEVAPCTSTNIGDCYGTLGPSGGVVFSYKVQASFKNVTAWYTTKWHLSGGGGEIAEDGESGSRTFATISDGNTNDSLYGMNIIGDKSSTEITFSSSSLTDN
jgi:hypothetical protein